MKKIFIWGTGSLAINLLPVLALNYEICGFIDSFKTGSLLGKQIINPEELGSFNYDEIVVCSSFIDEIKLQVNQLELTNIVYLGLHDNNQLLGIFSEYSNILADHRRRKFKPIKTAKLEYKHINTCKLIPNRSELLKLMPKNSICAEIGVAAGDYTKEILNIVKPSILHLVDIWDSDRYSELLFNKVSNLTDGHNVQIHRKLSLDAVNDFTDNYFDWIYIDTDHGYDTTYNELASYKNKVKDNGFIMGHDYTMGNWESSYRYGVMEAVHNFCHKYNYKLLFLTMDLTENQSFAIQKIL